MRIPAFAALFLISISLHAGDSLTLEQRLETEHLKAVHEARLKWAKERKPLLTYSMYDDFRTIIGVHAGEGARKEALEAAKKHGISVVVFRGSTKNADGAVDGVLALSGMEERDGGFTIQ